MRVSFVGHINEDWLVDASPSYCVHKSKVLFQEIIAFNDRDFQVMLSSEFHTNIPEKPGGSLDVSAAISPLPHLVSCLGKADEVGGFGSAVNHCNGGGFVRHLLSVENIGRGKQIGEVSKISLM